MVCCCLGSVMDRWLWVSNGELEGSCSLDCKSTSSAKGGSVGACIDKLF